MTITDRLRALPWVVRFGASCVAGIAAIVAICWVAFDFGSLGLDTAATVAAILGITFTVALGVALMGLVFYSNRSGQDDAAGAEMSDKRKR